MDTLYIGSTHLLLVSVAEKQLFALNDLSNKK